MQLQGSGNVQPSGAGDGHGAQGLPLEDDEDVEPEEDEVDDDVEVPPVDDDVEVPPPLVEPLPPPLVDVAVVWPGVALRTYFSPAPPHAAMSPVTVKPIVTKADKEVFMSERPPTIEG